MRAGAAAGSQGVGVLVELVRKGVAQAFGVSLVQAADGHRAHARAGSVHDQRGQAGAALQRPPAQVQVLHARNGNAGFQLPHQVAAQAPALCIQPPARADQATMAQPRTEGDADQQPKGRSPQPAGQIEEPRRRRQGQARHDQAAEGAFQCGQAGRALR
ncbi:hypothetical protein G6F32_013841 [Rhizopus arrhizus]|nr:hypothetical protein G6F32_013841 [Rhizopus arrhizus]